MRCLSSSALDVCTTRRCPASSVCCRLIKRLDIENFFSHFDFRPLLKEYFSHLFGFMIRNRLDLPVSQRCPLLAFVQSSVLHLACSSPEGSYPTVHSYNVTSEVIPRIQCTGFVVLISANTKLAHQLHSERVGARQYALGELAWSGMPFVW